ncbi:OTU domain-containing protein 6B [Beauveria brongniartii RCEF 3172]|uniref:OTU domain-containing protein 6B n=1 Tax=Beauveria brongniartii RCEF 3172 TaxID=1081107 RepID=A0A166WAM8_9HYPO|nr:OTU domain-containing protein 6B [Beauveria brongniartii RCEF 3172]
MCDIDPTRRKTRHDDLLKLRLYHFYHQRVLQAAGCYLYGLPSEPHLTRRSSFPRLHRFAQPPPDDEPFATAPPRTRMEAETVEQAQARHRKELKDLQGRITNKKKNATKKTRKAVNDDCEQLERALREQQAAEIAALNGEMLADDATDEGEETQLGADQALSQQVEAELNLATEEGTDRVDNTQQQQQQQSGKKRNRQKERLARRAADQAAAMTKAEMEASTMTNHRAIENAYMKKKMEAEGLVEQDIAPDGHCLFSAVADQLQTQLSIPLGGTTTTTTTITVSEMKEPAYKTVRRAATDFMESHGDDFAPFVEGDFPTYLARMRDTAEWGGEPELMALARAYGVEIRVVQDGRTEEIGHGEKVMWLAYYRHGYGLGEHYNSLRRLP